MSDNEVINEEMTKNKIKNKQPKKIKNKKSKNKKSKADIHMEKNNDTKQEKNKVYFHVVNSIKGGSGKSLFSLLLANHFTRENQSAYIIDLDVCGTSWNEDYDNFWITPPDSRRYLSSVMYQQNDGGFKFDLWSKLHIEDDLGTRLLNVCIAAPRQENMLYDNPETELLEHITYNVVKEIYTNETKNNSKSYHIIFDLPPNYEKSTEQICQHLLFDQTSKLKHLLKNEYNVCFYMITPFSQRTSLSKNISYIQNLVNTRRSYSTSILNFISENKLKINFVINDNDNLESILGNKPTLPHKNSLGLPGTTGCIDIDKYELSYLSYQKFNYKNNISCIGCTSKDKVLNITGGTLSEIKAIADSMIK